jgi:DNA-binding transcriptional LysR family regulator
VDEPLVLGVGPDDPWWGVGAVPIDDLRDRTLAGLPLGTGLRGALDGACAAAGFSPRIAFESGDLGIVADFGARGLGVAVLAESVAAARPDLHGVAVEPEVRSSLALAWRSSGPAGPAGRALLALARDAIPEVHSR